MAHPKWGSDTESAPVTSTSEYGRDPAAVRAPLLAQAPPRLRAARKRLVDVRKWEIVACFLHAECLVSVPLRSPYAFRKLE